MSILEKIGIIMIVVIAVLLVRHNTNEAIFWILMAIFLKLPYENLNKK
jgi:hypothetical protein